MAKAGGNLLNTYVADYVVFDLETTGISPKTDEVVEISGSEGGARQGLRMSSVRW